MLFATHFTQFLGGIPLRYATWSAKLSDILVQACDHTNVAAYLHVTDATSNAAVANNFWVE